MLNFPDVQIVVLCVSSLKVASSDRESDRRVPRLLRTFMIIWGCWKRLCPISYYFSKFSLLLIFSVGGGEMGPVPCATKTILCPWSSTCCIHKSYHPRSIQYSNFDSLPRWFSGEQDHTEQTQEDPGKHVVVLGAVFLDSSSLSLYRENDHCFWWFLQISCLNLAFSQEEVIGPKKKRKVSEPEELLLNGGKWWPFWHTIHFGRCEFALLTH